MLPQSGKYTFAKNTNIRSAESLNSAVVESYSKGQSLVYDSKKIADGFVWLSYLG
ncbi:SH3 domain-containing protein [Pisciglobus halotolerans]|uniref:SH3 domain-containing protein n=1 Tax=Pisciglobus halotolerans TaxID=745365 RepID=UPI000B816517